MTHVQINCACGWSVAHNCPCPPLRESGLVRKLREILPHEYTGDDEWADADKLSEVFNALWPHES